MDLKQSGEDYLEAVLNIQRQKGTVRAIDVANYLSVSKPSVTRAMGLLKNAGYINQQTYGEITLTNEGKIKAKEILNRHNTLCCFFISILGVEKEIANEDACKVEHVLSKHTMDKIMEFMQNKDK